jgi:hypothetical protein
LNVHLASDSRRTRGGDPKSIWVIMTVRLCVIEYCRLLLETVLSSLECLGNPSVVYLTRNAVSGLTSEHESAESVVDRVAI